MPGENKEKLRLGIGAVIKRYRENQRLTQPELAAAAGISLSVLRDLEQGRTRHPRWAAVEELAAVLGLGQAQRTELARAWRGGVRAAPVSKRRPRPEGRSPGVRIEVLGPLMAWQDGIELALGSARQRAVLGLLALHLRGGVHRDVIIDRLWGEQSPTSAVGKVQGYISRLRKVLGDASARAGNAELITTISSGCYRLNADSDQLDLAAFGMLIREAHEAAAQDDPALACDRYDQALGLWRGDVLVDVELLRDHPAVVEAKCRRAEAVLGYAKTAAEVGAHGRALPHLRELCATEPLNEPAHAYLMTTLAATGQQAAALRVFTDVRRRLDTELGIFPSPILIKAHARILCQLSPDPES